jgi:hypothetical protein
MEITDLLNISRTFKVANTIHDLTETVLDYDKAVTRTQYKNVYKKEILAILRNGINNKEITYKDLYDNISEEQFLREYFSLLKADDIINRLIGGKVHTFGVKWTLVTLMAGKRYTLQASTVWALKPFVDKADDAKNLYDYWQSCKTEAYIYYGKYLFLVMKKFRPNTQLIYPFFLRD